MSAQRFNSQRDRGRNFDSRRCHKSDDVRANMGGSGAWIPLLIGIVLVWPWLAATTCGTTGVCLSPGSHRKDGWISAHKVEASGWRLMFGVLAIGGGINGMAANRRR